VHLPCRAMSLISSRPRMNQSLQSIHADFDCPASTFRRAHGDSRRNRQCARGTSNLTAIRLLQCPRPAGDGKVPHAPTWPSGGGNPQATRPRPGCLTHRKIATSVHLYDRLRERAPDHRRNCCLAASSRDGPGFADGYARLPCGPLQKRVAGRLRNCLNHRVGRLPFFISIVAPGNNRFAPEKLWRFQ